MIIDRCLSVRQPFAWAIAADLKRIENRTWSTDYLGTVAIHASTSVSAVNTYRKKTGNPFFSKPFLPTGAIVGTAKIVDVALYGRKHEGDGFATGPFCWSMPESLFLKEPIVLKGKRTQFKLPSLPSLMNLTIWRRIR